MITLENKTLKNFLLKDIIRPYQNMLGINEKETKKFDWIRDYYMIPNYITAHPEWWKITIERLSRIYCRIDISIFPIDQTADIIIQGLMSVRIKLDNRI